MSKKRNLMAATLVATVAMLMAARAQAQSPVAGYTSIAVPPNSDVLVSVPMVFEAAESGEVNGVSGTDVDVTGASFDGTYTNTPHYVRITSGSNNGRWSTITEIVNSTTLRVADAAALSGVAVNDTLDIMPHRTLGNVFPAWLEGQSFIASANAISRKTEVYMFGAPTAINQSAPDTYYYLTNTTLNAWRKVGQSTSVSYNNAVIPPDRYVILRNNVDTNLTYFAIGYVPQDVRQEAVVNSTVKVDLRGVSGRPVPMTLAQLGLGGTPAFVARPTALGAGDELWMYNNAATGKNKSYSAGTYYYFNNGWRKVGTSSAIDWSTSNVVEAASGFIIRKALTNSPTTEVWTQNAPY